MKKLVFLFTDYTVNDYRRKHDLYGGIGYYRVIKPAQVLKKWFDIEVVGADFEKWGTTAEKYDRLKEYDLIVARQFRTGADASNTLAAAKHFKKKVLLDVDDNLLAVRKDNPAYKDYEYGQGNREYMMASIALASGVMVSTNPLKNVYKHLNKKIDVLPNCNDVNDWPAPKKWDDGKIRIGFAGGQGHLADLELILEPMAYILAKHPNVQFDIVGSITPQQAMTMGVRMNEYCKKNITQQFRIAGGTQAWQGYPEMMAGFGWDIVLAPLVDDAFNNSKSHIRWMEASMIKAPVVASPVYPYSADIQGVKTIQDEKTGLFAHNAEEWFVLLDGLIQHPEAREELAENAYNYIKDNWQYEQHAEKWHKVINKYL